MKITKSWLTKNGACPEGVAWWKASGLTDHAEIALKLLGEEQYSWASWMVARLMNHKNKVRYAIRAGREVLPIFEARYPDDKRPRIALDTAEMWTNGEATREECRAAYVAAASAAYVAAAASAAYVAAASADFAAASADFAAASADVAATAAAAYVAADAKRRTFWIGQIMYGLKLTEDKMTFEQRAEEYAKRQDIIFPRLFAEHGDIIIKHGAFIDVIDGKMAGFIRRKISEGYLAGAKDAEPKGDAEELLRLIMPMAMAYSYEHETPENEANIRKVHAYFQDAELKPEVQRFGGVASFGQPKPGSVTDEMVKAIEADAWKNFDAIRDVGIPLDLRSYARMVALAVHDAMEGKQ